MEWQTGRKAKRGKVKSVRRLLSTISRHVDDYRDELDETTLKQFDTVVYKPLRETRDYIDSVARVFRKSTLWFPIAVYPQKRLNEAAEAGREKEIILDKFDIRLLTDADVAAWQFSHDCYDELELGLNEALIREPDAFADAEVLRASLKKHTRYGFLFECIDNVNRLKTAHQEALAQYSAVKG